MQVVAGPLFVAALLLVAGGVPKLLKPAATRGALDALGLPSSPSAVRALGIGEIAVGGAVVVVGGPLPALMLAATYASFAGFVLWALLRPGRVSSCGCFGSDDTPPTRWHLAMDVAAAGVGLAAAGTEIPALLPALSNQPLAGIPFLAFVAMGAWFGYLALSQLPALMARANA